ncbi:4-diphosphocytidyl-2-C-methyl-D-erythritol kinase [Alphaproteobacteria bacterium SO-S41]|nr:4-diphosphocytidyl-2-C-methyl-D-erythritol kinase [Alphaproteobacteria bacterium SO-S41]
MTPTRLDALARAKINLFLHVGARRTDGFHSLASWAVFAAIGDKLQVEIVDGGISLTLDGTYAARTPSGPENLVLRAAEAMRTRAVERGAPPPLGARLRLTKLLPVASGIGGGSADAAAALHLLNELWGLSTDGKTLMEFGAALGSDVPVCVYNRSALMSGRGEMLAPGPGLPPIPIVLCNPDVELSTAEVFAALGTRRGSSMPILPYAIESAAQLAAELAETGNDLEAPAMALAPTIGEALYALRGQTGALLARMSGSGATCFAIFADDDSAQAAALNLKRLRPNWWIAASRLDC